MGMKIIEKNSGSKNSGTIKSKKQPLQSTIIVEAKRSLQPTKPVETKKPLRSTKIIEENQSERAQVDEDEDEEIQIDDSLLYIAAEEEKNSNTSLITPLDTSILPTSSRSGKRPHEESDTNSKINKKKRSTGSVSVPFSVYSAKEKECMLLTAQVADFEQNWMPRSKDPKVIQYLIEIRNILSGNKNEDDEVDKEKVLEDIMKELKMSEDDLSMCHGATATKTV